MGGKKWILYSPLRRNFLLIAGEAGELFGKRAGFGEFGGVVRFSSKSRKRLIMVSSVVNACVCNATDDFTFSVDGVCWTSDCESARIKCTFSSLRRFRASVNCFSRLMPVSNLRHNSGDRDSVFVKRDAAESSPKRCLRENNGLSA